MCIVTRYLLFFPKLSFALARMFTQISPNVVIFIQIGADCWIILDFVSLVQIALYTFVNSWHFWVSVMFFFQPCCYIEMLKVTKNNALHLTHWLPVTFLLLRQRQRNSGTCAAAAAVRAQCGYRVSLCLFTLPSLKHSHGFYQSSALLYCFDNKIILLLAKTNGTGYLQSTVLIMQIVSCR